VIALPSVRGQERQSSRPTALALYAFAVVAGALVTAALVQLGAALLGHLPPAGAGAVALASAVAAATTPDLYPSSAWRVPRTWGWRFGPRWYAMLFGGILGLGFLTAVPSISFYTLVAWGLTAHAPANVWLVFALFGVARAIPSLVVVTLANTRHRDPVALLDQARELASALLAAEIWVLAAIGIMLLI
jgi:hypothetical protein